eukprot:6323866-Alexandrium_andersonii.AAC.1
MQSIPIELGEAGAARLGRNNCTQPSLAAWAILHSSPIPSRRVRRGRSLVWHLGWACSSPLS